MKLKFSLLVASCVAISLGAGAALAQPDETRDPDGYYSRSDHDGYYDGNGQYRHQLDGGDDNSRDTAGPLPSDYREGDYERNCRRGNGAAGTVFGAIDGGLIGSAASHGNGGAVMGGVLMGGLLGNALTRDVDCGAQRDAFNSYADGFNGDIGRRYAWHHGPDYGSFTPTREYQEQGLRCRDFTETTYRGGQQDQHDGSACYERDGNWHMR
jgi:surface antigen